MDYTHVRSSNINSIGYDDQELILGVIFKSGSEYHYYNVPRDIFQKLISAPSVGRYLNQNIKDKGYKYKKIK